MRAICLGGGPAGLYFAISLKLRQPEADVTVLERNRADDTFGWGVVLSDETLDNLEVNDPVSAREIRSHFAYWDDIALHHKGNVIHSTGHGFCGIGRKRLLLILQERARALGGIWAWDMRARDMRIRACMKRGVELRRSSAGARLGWGGGREVRRAVAVRARASDESR